MITSLTEEQCDYLENITGRYEPTTGFYINRNHELALFSISAWQLKHTLKMGEFISEDFNEFMTLYEQHQLLKTLGE